MAKDSMRVESPTHIKVLIVGAGLGGLYAAIECHRQGHSVSVVESKPELEGLGDFVGIGPSVVDQFHKWPPMAETYSSIVYQPAMKLLTYDGTFLGGPFLLSESSHYRPVPVSRPKLISALYDYASSLGIEVLFNKRVVKYEDSNETNRAYAITDKGERFEADVVVAADGIGSKTGRATSGKEPNTMSSGYSVFRVTYPTSILQEDPFLAEQYRLEPGEPDICDVYIGPRGNVIILVAPDITTWLFVHEVGMAEAQWLSSHLCLNTDSFQDNGQAQETWSTRLSASDALKCLDDTGLKWDGRIAAVIARTPPKTVVDYKIIWRDPDPIWTSPNGRVVKIGDAAHAFIPNSTYGATAAMEDGISLAACLRLAGKGNVSLATKAHTRLRFERTSCAQKAGFRNREKWDREAFEHVKKNPMSFARSVGRWLSDHNPEQYVYDNWQACSDHLLTGNPFHNTNIPAGYVYEPWTMEGMTAASRNGILPVDDGDWE